MTQVQLPDRSGPGEVWLARPPSVAAGAIAGELVSFDELRERFRACTQDLAVPPPDGAQMGPIVRDERPYAQHCRPEVVCRGLQPECELLQSRRIARPAAAMPVEHLKTRLA